MCWTTKNSHILFILKKCVVLQVNDAAVRIRLVVFVSYVELFYIQTGWGEGGGERGEGCHPSDLLCWLTVIWSGAPTDSLGEAHIKHVLHVLSDTEVDKSTSLNGQKQASRFLCILIESCPL
jgi:hypothetical protein